MPKRFLFPILVAGLVLALSQKPISQDAGSDMGEKIFRFILSEIEERFGKSLQDIQKKLGEAQRIIEKKTENIHVRGVEETVLRVQYAGISFIFLKENDLHKEFLVEAVLTGKDYDLSWGLRIGISRDELLEIFGEPKKRLEKNSVYRYTDFEDLNYVDFFFERENLSKIHWVFYVD